MPLRPCGRGPGGLEAAGGGGRVCRGGTTRQPPSPPFPRTTCTAPNTCTSKGAPCPAGQVLKCRGRGGEMAQCSGAGDELRPDWGAGVEGRRVPAAARTALLPCGALRLLGLDRTPPPPHGSLCGTLIGGLQRVANTAERPLRGVARMELPSVHAPTESRAVWRRTAAHRGARTSRDVGIATDVQFALNWAFWDGRAAPQSARPHPHAPRQWDSHGGPHLRAPTSAGLGLDTPLKTGPCGRVCPARPRSAGATRSV